LLKDLPGALSDHPINKVIIIMSPTSTIKSANHNVLSDERHLRSKYS